MSRGRRKTALPAKERWPALYQFLAGYLHQDWFDDSGTVEAALDEAIADHDLAALRQVVDEWQDWMAEHGSTEDPRAAINDGLGVDVHFEQPVDGHHFLNEVYDKLIASIRPETGDGWKA